MLISIETLRPNSPVGWRCVMLHSTVSWTVKLI